MTTTIDKPDTLTWPTYWHYVTITTCITVIQSRPYGNTHHALDQLANQLPQDNTT